jgi:hypothetical protein
MTVHEIHVKRQPNTSDPRGKDVSVEAPRILGIKTKVSTTTIYKRESN